MHDDFKTLVLNQIPQFLTSVKMELCREKGRFDKRDATDRHHLCYPAAPDEAQAPWHSISTPQRLCAAANLWGFST